MSQQLEVEYALDDIDGGSLHGEQQFLMNQARDGLRCSTCCRLPWCPVPTKTNRMYMYAYA